MIVSTTRQLCGDLFVYAIERIESCVETLCQNKAFTASKYIHLRIVRCTHCFRGHHPSSLADRLTFFSTNR